MLLYLLIDYILKMTKINTYTFNYLLHNSSVCCRMDNILEFFMLKPTTIEDLNKIHPQYSFAKEGGGIYCFNENHEINRIAECGYTDYFSFTSWSMTQKISPEHFNDVHTCIKQLLSTYLFFCQPFFEKTRKQFYLFTLQNVYCNRMVMGQQVVVNYVTKFSDNQIYWSPEIQMGNDYFYLHLTNYSTVNEFHLNLSDSLDRMTSITITVDEIKNNHSKLIHFFFDNILKPYIGIEADSFRMDHFKVIDMMVI